ncbi:MAG: aminopeptidase P family protein [Chloroflexia bacterium]|nr:aminopeptidase P family protein [Chloroflexia bacterium]
MKDRIDRLREVAVSLGADATIVTHPANRRYFSGFPDTDYAPDESSGVLLVTNESAVLYMSPTNLPWAESTVRAPVVVLPRTSPWQTFLGEYLRDNELMRVAFEDRALTVADHAAIVAAAPAVNLIPAGTSFHALRAIKELDELASIAKAAGITDAAFLAATTRLVAGVTERELAWRIDLAMRELGAEGPGFPTIVAAGPHGARPHHDPGERPIAESEPIVIDMGAMVDGYSADLTRTICLGQPSPEYTARYAMVLAAQLGALAGIRPGMTGREADAIAREALTASEVEALFVHGLGHGVGLLIHEYPSLGKISEDVLEPGHVLTIEPGIYYEGWGGIRIEDLCVVTATGLDILSNAPK